MTDARNLGCGGAYVKSDGEPADRSRLCCFLQARDVHLLDFMWCCGLKSIRNRQERGYSTATLISVSAESTASVTVAERVVRERLHAAAPQILFVTASLGIGGTEQQLVMLAAELNRRGYRVMVFSLATGPLLGALKAERVPTLVARARLRQSRSLSIFNLALAATKLFALLIRHRPAVVHFFLPEAYLLGAPLAAVARIPIRVMSRRSLNVYQQNHPGLVAWIERALHRTMTAILGNSRSVVRQLLEIEGVDSNRLGLIYNGVDTARFATGLKRGAIRASTRSAFNLPSQALVIVMVANLIVYKGHLDLLEALHIISGHLPVGWRLLLVGHDEGIGDKLRAQAHALAIDDHVVFLGSRVDVPEILLASDIGILCSHQEGFSNAVLEGMAAGLPMVVTAAGGNPEAVIDGETGIVVPPNNPPRLADGILRLIVDPDLRARFGDAGRVRVAANFSINQCVANYDGLYRMLLAGGVPCDLPQIRVVL